MRARRARPETEALGVDVGDFVYLDAEGRGDQRSIRSRHLDDKAGVAPPMARC